MARRRGNRSRSVIKSQRRKTGKFWKRAAATGDNVTVLDATDLRIQKQLRWSVSRYAHFTTTYRKRPAGHGGAPPHRGHHATGAMPGRGRRFPPGPRLRKPSPFT